MSVIRRVFYGYVLLCFMAAITIGETVRPSSSESESIDMIYHEITISLMVEVISEKNKDLLKDIEEHGAENVHSILTTCVAQSFYIFFTRKNMIDESQINRTYKKQIRRILLKIGRNNAEKIIRKGFDIDGEKNEDFRYGISFFGDKVPNRETLEKSLKMYLDIAN